MIDDVFVIDAVVHAYNQTPENFADPAGAGAISELAYAMGVGNPDPRYDLLREVYLSDWQVPDLANLLFRESETDVAVFHPLAISAFKDGYVSLEKAAQALQDYPNRFIGSYACVDPLTGRQALHSLERQVDMLKPLGLKLYPTSWDGGKAVSWRMDDPTLIYPLYEKAAELGLKHVAVHKAVPIGPIAVGDAYNPSDLENAAVTFPELNFEIVHGGLAFVEETAWLLGRFGNISINMEIQNIIVERRPRAFANILLGLCHVAGSSVLDRMFWGSGGTLIHPQPGLRAFMEFEFPQDLLDGAGMFIPVQQITMENKRNMLSGTFARLHGIDIDKCKQSIAGDEFSRAEGEQVPEPYSTISLAHEVDAWRASDQWTGAQRPVPSTAERAMRDEHEATLRAAILRRLDRIQDPCSVAGGSPMGLTEMGLVGSVEISDDGDVAVHLRLTSPFCHMIAFMQSEAQSEVGALPGVRSVRVTGDQGLDWSPDLISPEAQARRRRQLPVGAR